MNNNYTDETAINIFYKNKMSQTWKYIQGEPIIYVFNNKIFLLLCSFCLTLLLTAKDIILN